MTSGRKLVNPEATTRKETANNINPLSDSPEIEIFFPAVRSGE
jgi:hypothetical protein